MFRYVIVFITFIVLFTIPAYAARLALVIGNGNYNPSANQLKLGKLKNPVYDAIDIAESLKKFGFEVILKTDANEKTMKRAIRDFGQRLYQQRGGGRLVLFFRAWLSI